MRRGERGTKVIFVKQLRIRESGADAGEEGDEKIVPMLREYTVFNIAQCENLPDSIISGKPARVRNPDTRDNLADEFLRPGTQKAPYFQTKRNKKLRDGMASKALGNRCSIRLGRNLRPAVLKDLAAPRIS